MSAQVTDRLPGGRGGRAGRGRGAGGPVEIVADMRKRGFTDEDIRAHLKALGYKSPRISQVMMKKKEPAASEPPPPLASGDDPEIPLGGTETPIAAAPSPSPGDFHSDESDGDPGAASTSGQPAAAVKKRPASAADARRQRQASAAVLGHAPDPAAPLPHLGAPILVLQERWLENILMGVKTLEIRCQPLKPKWRYLGFRQLVWGRARFGEPLLIESDEDWVNLRDQHLQDRPDRPYKKTYALPVLEVQCLGPVPYLYRPGQLGTVIFKPVEMEDDDASILGGTATPIACPGSPAAAPFSEDDDDDDDPAPAKKRPASAAAASPKKRPASAADFTEKMAEVSGTDDDSSEDEEDISGDDADSDGNLVDFIDDEVYDDHSSDDPSQPDDDDEGSSDEEYLWNASEEDEDAVDVDVASSVPSENSDTDSEPDDEASPPIGEDDLGEVFAYEGVDLEDADAVDVVGEPPAPKRRRVRGKQACPAWARIPYPSEQLDVEEARTGAAVPTAISACSRRASGGSTRRRRASACGASRRCSSAPWTRSAVERL